MNHFIDGEKIYLRGVVPTDVGPDYFTWMNDYEVTKYLETHFFPRNYQQLAKYVEEMTNRADTVFLAIIRREGDRHIGNIKLGPIDWIHRRGELGITIGDKASWGQGFGEEAITLLAKYAFYRLNLHKVTAGYYAVNDRSKRVFEKSGFTVEGVRESHLFTNGTYVDYVMVGMINK